MKSLLALFLPRFLSLLLGALATSGLVQADVLELKDGTLLQGTYIGGSTGTIRFETSLGTQVIPREQAVALTFTATPKAAAVAAQPVTAAPQNAGVGTAPVTAQPAATPAPAMRTGPVTLPAGTLLLVRMDSQVTSASPQGTRFTAHLESNLTLQDQLVAPAGTKVFGRVQEAKQARRLTGRSTLVLGISEIELDGRLYTVVTSNFAEAGPSSFRKTARNAAVGAIIGGAVDGSKGAGKGAAIGAGASVLSKGQGITVPRTALLEFRLTQPVIIGS